MSTRVRQRIGYSTLVLMLLGIRYASGMVFEAALLIALASCVASAALAKFLLRGEVIE